MPSPTVYIALAAFGGGDIFPGRRLHALEV